MKTKNLLCLFVVALVGCGSVPEKASIGKQFSQLNGPNPKKILFIHGMFLTPKSWEAWMQYFRKAGYQVTAEPWPLHDTSIEVQRTPESKKRLAQLELSQVLDHYRKILRDQPVKPILIGHSMGGLIAQILLTEGLGQAAVAIDSAPPKGLLVVDWSFFKSNWDSIRPFADLDKPIDLDFESFSYAFTNTQSLDEQKRAYNEFYVPESRRVGKGPTTDIGAVVEGKSRGPLLIVAGGKDHIIPAKLNYKNFKKYQETPSYTEFLLAPERDHWTVGAPGWEHLALQIQDWIEANYSKGGRP